MKKVRLMMMTLMMCLMCQVSFGQEKATTPIDSSLQIQMTSLKTQLSTTGDYLRKSQNQKYLSLGVMLVGSTLTMISYNNRDFITEVSGFPIVIPTLTISSSLIIFICSEVNHRKAINTLSGKSKKF